jgi:hypothetical protein
VSVQASLKESQENEVNLKKELEAKHALAMEELEKKLKASESASSVITIEDCRGGSESS